MSTPLLVVSTVGTSILSHGLSRNDEASYALLRRTANCTEAELSPPDKEGLDRRHQEVLETLLGEDQDPGSSRDRWRTASAEINGIEAYYTCKGIQPGSRDNHVLVVTDTYHGSLAGDLVEYYLEQYRGVKPVQLRFEGLSARNSVDFKRGLVQLGAYCVEQLPGHRKAGYQIVFNLTGGFKVVQACMNTIGMIYADEMVYIFDGPSREPVIIPHLPVKLSVPELASQHAAAFELLHRGATLDASSPLLSGIPESLVDTTPDGRVVTNLWGEVVWSGWRQKVLAGNPLEWPHLEYQESFRQDWDKRVTDRRVRVKIQETLAHLSNLLHEDPTYAAASSDSTIGLRPYSHDGKHGGEGLFHFNCGDYRVSCKKKSVDGRPGLLLRRVGPHDAVNGDP